MPAMSTRRTSVPGSWLDNGEVEAEFDVQPREHLKIAAASRWTMWTPESRHYKAMETRVRTRAAQAQRELDAVRKRERD